MCVSSDLYFVWIYIQSFYCSLLRYVVLVALSLNKDNPHIHILFIFFHSVQSVCVGVGGSNRYKIGDKWFNFTKESVRNAFTFNQVYFLNNLKLTCLE